MVSLLKQQLFFRIKKIFIIVFILTTLYFILNTSPIFAQSKILINEFLIDPQPQSVEIFNSGSESADISDWIIDDSGGTTFYTIPKDNIIFPNQCLVFSADFNLNKTSSDIIRLINRSQQLIDSFSYKSSSGSGISYFRQPDAADSWTTGSANLGFYNVSKEQKCLFPTLTPSPTMEPTLTIMPTEGSGNPTPTEIQPTPTDSTDLTNVYLSETMINPPTGENEWVEIYNDNDFSVSLNNWYIDDLENAGSTPKIFSLEISGKSYAVFNLTSSMFNNDGDNVRLLDFNKNLKDDFEYQETDQGKTLGRIRLDSDDFCLQEPSKDSINNPCINSSPTLIASVKTKQISVSPTKNVIQTKAPTVKNNNFDVSTLPAGRQVHRSINYDNGDVLGITSNTTNNNSLISLLSILSTSYSLLVIISILIKSKALNKYAVAS